MIDYRQFFPSEEDFEEFVDKAVEYVLRSQIINGINYITDRAGRRWLLEKWTTRALRTAIANDLLENTLKLGEEYDQDLYFSSYLFDSSNLCLNYQNKIYSKKGERYPLLSSALWKNGGGLLHPNCRHLIEPYFEGLTDMEENTIDNEEVKENYYKRQEFLKYQNNYRKYKQKARISKELGLDDTKYRAKAREWQKRKNKLPKPFDSAYDLKY